MKLSEAPVGSTVTLSGRDYYYFDRIGDYCGVVWDIEAERRVPVVLDAHLGGTDHGDGSQPLTMLPAAWLLQ